MRTAILAGGIAVVRSGVWCFAEDGELALSCCSLATGLLGQTALGAKKSLWRPFGATNGLFVQSWKFAAEWWSYIWERYAFGGRL